MRKLKLSPGKYIVVIVLVLSLSIYYSCNNNSPPQATPKSTPAPSVQSKVKGYSFWPYWVSYGSYRPDWSCLDYVAYFAADANADGTLDTKHIGYEYASLRNLAKSNNVKMPIVVTCFNQDVQDRILANSRDVLVDNIIKNVKQLAADGVCIDFEDVREINSVSKSSNTLLMENFIKSLYAGIKKANPGYHVSFCTMCSVETVFRNSALANSADAVFLMAYDYHWSTGKTTGAISPLRHPDQIDLDDSVAILKQFYPAEKIIAGLPFYGYDWMSTSDQPGAATVGEGTIVYMESAVSNAQTHFRLWDAPSNTPWYKYQIGKTWHQCWYEDTESLSLKFDFLLSSKVGFGFWALGFEGENSPVWELVKKKYSIQSSSGK